jgi:pimeloyl-ACP methyl ester carboxylesterase
MNTVAFHCRFAARRPGFRGASRRFVVLLLMGLAALVGACATAGTPRTMTLSEDELARLVARQLPLEHKVLDVVGLRLDSAKLRLLPERNRLAAEMNATATEPFGGNDFPARIALDFALRFNEATQAIEMSEVRVNRLHVDNIPAVLQEHVGGSLGREITQELLDGLPLYKFRQRDLQIAQGLGLRPGAIEVTPRGVEIALLPVR